MSIFRNDFEPNQHSTRYCDFLLSILESLLNSIESSSSSETAQLLEFQEIFFSFSLVVFQKRIPIRTASSALITVPCECEDCQELLSFLRDRKRQSWAVSDMSKERRKHIHRMLDHEETITGCGVLEHKSTGTAKNRTMVLMKPVNKLVDAHSKKQDELIVLISQFWSRNIFILSRFLKASQPTMTIDYLLDSLSTSTSTIPQSSMNFILKTYLPKVSNELIEKQDSLSQLISQYNMNRQPSFSDHYLNEPSPTKSFVNEKSTTTISTFSSLFLLDIEHCGGEIVNSSIVSIACVHVLTGRWFYTSVRPDQDEQLKTLSSRIHRKKEEELKQCDYWNVIGKQFIDFIESFGLAVDLPKLLISHSKNNLDMAYIKILNQKHNLQTPLTWDFGNSLATLELLCPEFAYSQKGGIGYSIRALSEKLNISNSKKHDPRFDLICLASILKRLLSPIPLKSEQHESFEEKEDVDENHWIRVLLEKVVISNEMNISLSTTTTTTQNTTQTSTMNSQTNENSQTTTSKKKRKADNEH